MIIQRRFHTYKDDFPLMSHGRLPYNGDTLHDLMTNLIFELSDLTRLPPFAYITRHTNDKIPPEHLAPFLTKFPQFVNILGKGQPYNIPTVWFVGHFQDHDSITEVRQKLNQKNLKYFEGGEEYDSFEQIGKNYCEEREDAKLFVKFLHQVTMIGIDLLPTADYKQKLKQLGRLEYMQYTNIADAKSDFKEMERYLRESSTYYKKHITANASEYKEFWENFTKIKVTDTGNGRARLGSWPHFLFNICGISFTSKVLPLKVKMEDLFEDWR